MSGGIISPVHLCCEQVESRQAEKETRDGAPNICTGGLRHGVVLLYG